MFGSPSLPDTEKAAGFLKGEPAVANQTVTRGQFPAPRSLDTEKAIGFLKGELVVIDHTVT